MVFLIGNLYIWVGFWETAMKMLLLSGIAVDIELLLTAYIALGN